MLEFFCCRFRTPRGLALGKARGGRLYQCATFPGMLVATGILIVLILFRGVVWYGGIFTSGIDCLMFVRHLIV